MLVSANTSTYLFHLSVGWKLFTTHCVIVDQSLIPSRMLIIQLEHPLHRYNPILYIHTPTPTHHPTISQLHLVILIYHFLFLSFLVVLWLVAEHPNQGHQTLPTRHCNWWTSSPGNAWPIALPPEKLGLLVHKELVQLHLRCFWGMPSWMLGGGFHSWSIHPLPSFSDSNIWICWIVLVQKIQIKAFQVDPVQGDPIPLPLKAPWAAIALRRRPAVLSSCWRSWEKSAARGLRHWADWMLHTASKRPH